MPTASEDKVRLFIAYSRFEFSLKENGYIRPDKDGIAHADWRAFAKEEALRDIFEEAKKDIDVRELIAKPPMTQITSNSQTWHWEERLPKPAPNLLALFLSVKTIRDNLFHGGKQGENPRDDQLCKAAWHVLQLCLDRHHAVRAMFEYKY